MRQHDRVHPCFPRHFPQPSGRAAILAFWPAGHTPDLALALALGPAFALPLGFAAGVFLLTWVQRLPWVQLLPVLHAG